MESDGESDRAARDPFAAIGLNRAVR